MDMFSNNHKLVVTAVIASLLGATPLLAQSGEGERVQQVPERRAPDQPPLRIVKHDTIVGTAVTNGLEADKAETLGSISDLVVDSADGHVRYAVLKSGGTLGVGERLTTVAWAALTWDAKASRFTLAMTADAIKQLPVFDAKNLRGLEKGGADAGAGNGGNGSHAATARRGEAGHSPADMRGSLVLASQIRECQVLAGKDKVGAGDTLLIETKTGCAAFLTVASGGVLGIGGTDYVVPWAALRLVRPVDEQEMQIQLGKNKEALATAPKLSDEDADVNKPEFRARVYEFYGVKRPAFEPEEAKAADKNKDRIKNTPRK